MGYYINKTSKGDELPSNGKVLALLADGAKLTSPIWQENLICVVENGYFDAAGYAFSEKEFEHFNSSTDQRPKTWMTHPMAKELAE